MSGRRALWAAALAAAAPAALLPVSNPDLFWHLSAARRLWELRAVPRADWLSWTLPGTPWVDFEWLSQALFGAVHAAAGLGGLWALKVALLAAAAWRLLAWLELYGLAPARRAAALAAWAAGMLPRSDARPELFSVIFFAELFRRLERWRLHGEAPALIWLGAGFALWANLHAGFAYGLILLAVYCIARRSWRPLAAALAGTLAQPAGWRVYEVLASHGADAARLSRWIVEWGPPDPSNPWRWAELALAASAAGVWLAAWRRGERPAGAPSAAMLLFATAMLRHERLGAYAVTAAAPLAAAWLPAEKERPEAAARAVVLIAVCGGWALACGWSFGVFRAVFQDRFVPAAAAAFLEAEAGTLAGRPLYNPWGWGGYLGWRLAPAYRVFQDGRYIFHGLLAESARASSSPDDWRSFLGRRGVEVALLENVGLMVPSTRRYPDGTERPIPRPYHVFYMPKAEWALVHVDAKALVFVRRGRLPAGWLAAREYRWVRPHDDEALADALGRGEVPAHAVAAEEARLAAQLAAGGSR